MLNIVETDIKQKPGDWGKTTETKISMLLHINPHYQKMII